MVILFSERKSHTEKEIIKILTDIGATYISDKTVFSGKNNITIVSEYKKTDIKIKKGIAIITDNTERFNKQNLPKEIIGICEDYNTSALKVFSKNPVEVITCGMNQKNTITLSSKNQNSVLITLQRNLTDMFGKIIEPAEFLINTKENYGDYSIMASVTVMLLYGIIPKEI